VLESLVILGGDKFSGMLVNGGVLTLQRDWANDPTGCWQVIIERRGGEAPRSITFDEGDGVLLEAA
jgi:hypothetical protein